MNIVKNNSIDVFKIKESWFSDSNYLKSKFLQMANSNPKFEIGRGSELYERYEKNLNTPPTKRQLSSRWPINTIGN